MKKVLLTTTAIVGLSAPAFAADPTAVSDQPYFHHSHPMTWSGSMSIKLTNPSSSAIDTASTKALKRDNLFSTLPGTANGEEGAVGEIANVANGTEATCHAAIALETKSRQKAVDDACLTCAKRNRNNNRPSVDPEVDPKLA